MFVWAVWAPVMSSYIYLLTTYRHERLFEQYGLECRVQGLLYVLTQDRHADTDTVLQGSQEVTVRQLDYLQTILVFLVPDPAISLNNQDMTRKWKQRWLWTWLLTSLRSEAVKIIGYRLNMAKYARPSSVCCTAQRLRAGNFAIFSL